MKVIDLIEGMYNGIIPSIVSFNMYGDRYTAYYNTRTMKLKIEDYQQDMVCITNYYEEIEILDDVYLEKIKKEDLINHLVNDCGCVIEDTPKEDISNLKWGEYVIKQDVKKCSEEDLRTYISLLMETQNELIDYLKSKGE
jgi:hypothetical protein